jgi:hypothetical protein
MLGASAVRTPIILTQVTSDLHRSTSAQSDDANGSPNAVVLRGLDYSDPMAGSDVPAIPLLPGSRWKSWRRCT